jgi:adenylate kinase
VIARPEYKGYMNILLVGIQGSGKGTLARKLVDKFGYNFFEMGQKLRNFAGLDEPESGVVRDLLAKGSLVGPELVERILLHYQSGHIGAPILFDGIPRTPEQKNLFDRVFPEYIVLFLDLSREMAIERLGGRRIDPVTGESFPRSFEGNFSPFTGNELVHREDDNPAAVSKRIDTFYANTLPLLALWAGEGKRVYTIDASQSIEDCAKQAEVVVGAYSTK